jgi:putative SOS response-associated peptidase YedK
MCGRVFLSTDGDAIAAVLGLLHDGRATGIPCADLPPTAIVPVAAVGRAGPVLTGMRWGLVPHWWRQEKPPTQTFNARRETLTSAPTFRGLLGRRRAVMAVTGFYEWKADPGASRTARKPRYRVRAQAGEGLWLAGLWDAHATGSGGSQASVSVITQPSQGVLSDLHTRMPWLLSEEEVRAWIDPASPWEAVSGLGSRLPPLVVERVEEGHC